MVYAIMYGMRKIVHHFVSVTLSVIYNLFM